MLMVQSLRVALKELSTVASERVVGSRKRSMAVVKGRSCATMIDKQLQRVMIRSVSSCDDLVPFLVVFNEGSTCML